MTGSERPLCDCPEPCACYAEGYAAGKDKAYFEVLANLEGPPHARGLLLSALPAESHGPPGQDISGNLRASGGLGTGGP